MLTTQNVGKTVHLEQQVRWYLIMERHLVKDESSWLSLYRETILIMQNFGFPLFPTTRVLNKRVNALFRKCNGSVGKV
jgi:hypothetical protein